MTCLIVDSDPASRAALAQFATLIEDLSVESECRTATEASRYLNLWCVDLLFVDLDMPETSALELTRHLKDNRQTIIFTASKKDFAADAFDLNAADYLVKPLTAARFIQAVARARDLLGRRRPEVRRPADEFIFIRDGNIVRRLKLDDILYAEAKGDYVKVYTRNKNYAVHSTFRIAEERLPAGMFIRVHRSYIVALNKIDCLQENGLVIDGKFVPVAGSYRKLLHQRINVI